MAHARDDAGVSSPPAYYDFTLRFPSFTLFVYNHSFTGFRFQEDPVADGEDTCKSHNCWPIRLYPLLSIRRLVSHTSSPHSPPALRHKPKRKLSRTVAMEPQPDSAQTISAGKKIISSPIRIYYPMETDV